MSNQEPNSKPEDVEEPREEGLDETICSARERVRATLAANYRRYYREDPHKWRAIAKRKKQDRDWIKASHPCDECEGIGETPNGRPCQKCNWKGRLPNS